MLDVRVAGFAMRVQEFVTAAPETVDRWTRATWSLVSTMR
jgi:hypothetical protein